MVTARQLSRLGTTRWVDFATRRFVRLVASLFVVITLTFAMVHLIPGNPVRAALGPTAAPSVVAERTAQLGLNHPLFQQYLDYVRGVLTFHLGTSIITDQPVSQTIATRLPATAELVGVALVLVLLLAIPIGMVVGILTDRGRHPRLLLVFTTVTSVFNTIPEFLMGVGLVYVFAVTLQWFPVAGVQGWSSVVLPAFALALGPAASLSRIVRVQMAAVLSQDYMRVAQGKRLPRHLFYLRHALPNMLVGALTVGGLLLGVLVAGAVVVENVFARLGLGTLIIQGITQQDYPVVQGVLLVLAVAVLILNLLVDVALVMLDPRSAQQSR